MPRLLFGVFPLVVCLVLNSAQAQFGDLADRVPDGANTIVMIDVERLLQSPIAKREGWSNRHQALFEAGLLMVPPRATQFLASAKLKYDTLTPEWQVALRKLDHEVAISEVALRYSGSVDEIGGRSIAVLPGDHYVIRFGPNMAGVG
jgi:hypothetical protein